MTKKRAYCKNTVQGSQRGRKYPPKLRAEVVMAMVASNNICAVARRYKVPESTIRSWLAEEAAKGDAFAEVGLVVYNSHGSYDRKLLDNDRRQLEALREHYDGLTMDDKNAANVARVLMDVAEKAAALTPTAKAADETEAAPPMICIGAEGTGDEAEVEVE